MSESWYCNIIHIYGFLLYCPTTECIEFSLVCKILFRVVQSGRNKVDDNSTDIHLTRELMDSDFDDDIEIDCPPEGTRRPGSNYTFDDGTIGMTSPYRTPPHKLGQSFRFKVRV